MTDLRIVDWVSWHSEYPEPEDPYSLAREAVLIKGIREQGIHHCGHCHQNHKRGAPLFSDGTIFLESQKNWAVTMEQAWCRSDEVQGIVKALGVGWSASYVGGVDPYSCGQCYGGVARYETFIGPIHAYRTPPTKPGEKTCRY